MRPPAHRGLRPGGKSEGFECDVLDLTTAFYDICNIS